MLNYGEVYFDGDADIYFGDKTPANLMFEDGEKNLTAYFPHLYLHNITVIVSYSNRNEEVDLYILKGDNTPINTNALLMSNIHKMVRFYPHAEFLSSYYCTYVSNVEINYANKLYVVGIFNNTLNEIQMPITDIVVNEIIPII